jgi:hypothetical protein
MKLQINKYESISYDEEIKYLSKCLNEMTSGEILEIDGVFGILREYFNEQISEDWFENLTDLEKHKKVVQILNKNIPNINSELSSHILNAIQIVLSEFKMEITGWSVLNIIEPSNFSDSNSGKYFLYCTTDCDFAIAYNYSLKKFIVCKEPFQEL